jgi:SAM-dependent methyltransferase
MGILGGTVAYKLLRRINPGGTKDRCDGSAYTGKSKLEVLFGPQIWQEVAGKVVIDFGCGSGNEALEMAAHGAKKVIGIDIRESMLERARQAAERANLAHLCEFTSETHERADVIFSIDSFEHFDDPAAILRVMRRLLKADGRAIIEFGPPWYHPFGGHLFSVLPWAHVIFSEKSLIRWRADFKTDGASRFHEIEGGLNQMTIRRFKRLIRHSDFQISHFETVPVRRAQFLLNPLTQEFFTATVRCHLTPRS